MTILDPTNCINVIQILAQESDYSFDKKTTVSKDVSCLVNCLDFTSKEEILSPWVILKMTLMKKTEYQLFTMFFQFVSAVPRN